MTTVYTKRAGTYIPSEFCEVGQHTTNKNRMYVYADAAHGIPEGHCCYECYAKHILEHYPDSLMAAHIRVNPDEFTNGDS